MAAWPCTVWRPLTCGPPWKLSRGTNTAAAAPPTQRRQRLAPCASNQQGHTGHRQQQYDATCHDIRACQSWPELRNVYSRDRQHLDRIQLAALLSGLARTMPCSGVPVHEVEEYQSLVTDVLSDAAKQALRPRELATAMWAAAKVGMPPHTWSAWLPQLLAATALKLSQGFKPQDLSMVLWALATLEEGAANSSTSFGGPSRATGAGIGYDWSQYQAKGYSVGQRRRQHLQLPHGLLDAMVHAAGSQMSSFGAQALSNMFWALAKLGKRPSDTWLLAALMHMETIMASCTPQALCNVAWALVIFEHSSGASWRKAFLRHSGLALEFAVPKVLAQLVWSTARLRLSPDSAWLETSLQRAASFDWQRDATAMQGSYDSASPKDTQRRWHAQHQAASARDLSNILWALAVQPRFKPSVNHMQRLVAASLQCLEGFQPNELCCLVWSLAKLGYAPPPHHMQQLLMAVASSASNCSAQGLCNVVWAVATLRMLPGQQWMQEVLSNLVPKLEDCGPQELANLWWALGSLRWRLGPELREELAAELRVNLMEFNAGETAMVLWALARLGLQPQPEVLQRQLELLCAVGSNNSKHSTAVDTAAGSGAWGAADQLQPRTVAATLWALQEMDRTVRQQRQRGSIASTGILWPRHRQTLRQLLLTCVQQTGQQQGNSAVTSWQPPQAAIIHRDAQLQGWATNTASPLPLFWGPKELALSLYSLGRLQVAPPDSWLLAALTSLQVVQPPMPPALQAGGQYACVGSEAGRASLQKESSDLGCAPPLIASRYAAPAAPATVMAPLAAATVKRPQAAVHMLPPAVQAAEGQQPHSINVSPRDAAMIAHGLAALQRQRAQREQARLRQHRLPLEGSRDTLPAAAGPTFVSQLVQMHAASVPLPAQLLSSCVRLLVQSMAARIDSTKDKELAMLLSALPVLTGTLRRRKQLRAHKFLLQQQKVMRTKHARQPPVLRECLGAVQQLLAAAQQRMEAGSMTSREAVCVASAAARLAVPVTLPFTHAIMACCTSNSGSGNSSSTGVSPAARPASPTCRDWVLCLSAVERLQPHKALLQGSTTRRWIAEAVDNITQLLSRPGRSLRLGESGQAISHTAVGVDWVQDSPAPAILAVGALQRMGHGQALNPASLHAPQPSTHASQPASLVQRGTRKQQRQLQWQQQQLEVWRNRPSTPLLLAVRRSQVAGASELQAAAAAAARLARSASAAARVLAARASRQGSAVGVGGRGLSAVASAVRSSPAAGKRASKLFARGVLACALPRGAWVQATEQDAGQLAQDERELYKLAAQLRRVSGLLTQVHWRRVHIHRATCLKREQRRRQLLTHSLQQR